MRERKSSSMPAYTEPQFLPIKRNQVQNSLKLNRQYAIRVIERVESDVGDRQGVSTLIAKFIIPQKSSHRKSEGKSQKRHFV